MRLDSLQAYESRLKTAGGGGVGTALLLGPDDSIFVGDNVTPLATSATARGGFFDIPGGLNSATSNTSQFWAGQVCVLV